MPTSLKVFLAASLTLLVNLTLWLFCFFTLISVIELLNFTWLRTGLLLFLFAPGLCQIVYLLPVYLYLAYKKQLALLNGLVVGTVLTALINGGSWLMIQNR
ncbi:MAG: hypothetical protein F6J97_15620 [Leptolyngbya sp. SIO4C1]|nr:hypothetical protein [Leptolyngbya sp. SIO4C1]